MTGIINQAMKPLYDGTNADHIAAMGALSTGIQGMISAGDEAGAKRVYNEKKTAFGFKDEDFGKFTSNMGLGGQYGYSGKQVNEWAANPDTSPVGATGGVGGAGTAAGVAATAGAMPITSSGSAYQSTVAPPAPTIAPVNSVLPAGSTVSQKPGQGAPYGARVTDWRVTPDQLVENRVNNLIAADSPLMQRAASTALQQANGRGLINSSMAVGAGQTAVLDAATNIAGRDAETYARASQFNPDSSNKASMFNAGQGNEWDSKELDRSQQVSERALDRGLQRSESGLDRNFKAGESLAERNLRASESQLDRAWKTAESASDKVWQSGEKSAERAARVDEYRFNAETSTALKAMEKKYANDLDADRALDNQYGLYVKAIFEIDNNPNFDAAAKKQMKLSQAVAFESFAKIRGLNLNLDFSAQYA